ncbi:hypothetical protein [Phytohabitans houttuyneae]|jgi:hypothetical protein|uniref:Uncharacterized protein n=1 Tax=Phytohabitans houttuyneae TaxID=1076126 RepID=A0A6V8KI20_9ACTN|nr:hypothetical protein [Phytohabitans houttuyneae]GFJ81646.1 hypothetical protein Phou_058260 [Phytohabitans houttuyneae]
MLAVVRVDVDVDRLATPPVLAPICELATTAETVLVCRTLSTAKAVVAGLRDSLPRHDFVCLASTAHDGRFGRAERDTLRSLVNAGVTPVLVDQDGTAAAHVMDCLDADLIVDSAALVGCRPDTL